jgi:hypothetical protein
MYDDNSTGGPEKYTKEQFQKMEKERFAAEARENAERDKDKAKEEAKAKKESQLKAEFNRGDIKVNQALSRQKSKDLDAKQDSLFRDETRSNPNRAEMERRAIADQEAKAVEREAKKAEKAAAGDASKQASMISPQGNTTAAGRGETSKGGGGGAMPKSNRDLTKNYKVGGKVSSASKRADGCAIRGKTRA